MEVGDLPPGRVSAAWALNHLSIGSSKPDVLVNGNAVITADLRNHGFATTVDRGSRGLLAVPANKRTRCVSCEGRRGIGANVGVVLRRDEERNGFCKCGLGSEVESC